jgi:hypothetical protein
MNKAILIFLCLFAFIFNDECTNVNKDKIGQLPKYFDCINPEYDCCLVAFKSGGKYYTYCGKGKKKDLKKKFKDYHIVDILCD